MNTKEEFIKHITQGYNSKGESITLGRALLDGAPIVGNPCTNPTKKHLIGKD